MSVVGHQDFWLAGSRFYFQREDQAGVEQPLVDLGVIQPVNPTFEIEDVELEDSDGGLRRVVDSGVTKIAESMDIVCSNLNLQNLSYLFLASSPAAFTQAATEVDVSTFITAGRLAKLKTALGVAVHGIDAIAGVYTGVIESKTIESITKSTKIIKLTGDQTAEAGLATGKAIIVRKLGLANIANSRTYTVVSAVLNATKTDVTVEEEPAADEPSITGDLEIEDTGTIFKQDTDWDVYNLKRGIVRALTGGALSTDAARTVIFTPTALSGTRLVQPQSLAGVIKGTGYLVWGRLNNADQTVREATVTIQPNASAIGAEDYSNITLTVKVISDITLTVPAGKLLQFAGTLPASS